MMAAFRTAFPDAVCLAKFRGYRVQVHPADGRPGHAVGASARYYCYYY
jgi:hypothetical protein